MIIKSSELTQARNLADGSAFAKKDSAAERSKLLDKSKERSSGWKNTTLGERQRRLEMIEEKKRLQEEQRKKQDKEWEKLMADEKAEFIRRAREKQFSQSEKARKLNSDLLQKLAQAERLRQIEYKRKLKDLETKRDSSELPVVEQMLKKSNASVTAAGESREKLMAEMREANRIMMEQKRELARLEALEREQSSAKIKKEAVEADEKAKEARKAKIERDIEYLKRANAELSAQKANIRKQMEAADILIEQEIKEYHENNSVIREMIKEKLNEITKSRIEMQKVASAAFVETETAWHERREEFYRKFEEHQGHFLMVGGNHKSPTEARDHTIPKGTLDQRVGLDGMTADERDAHFAFLSEPEQVQKILAEEEKKKEAKEENIRAEALSLRSENVKLAQIRRDIWQEADAKTQKEVEEYEKEVLASEEEYRDYEKRLIDLVGNILN